MSKLNYMCALAKQPLVLNITTELACNMHAQLALHSPGLVGLYAFILAVIVCSVLVHLVWR